MRVGQEWIVVVRERTKIADGAREATHWNKRANDSRCLILGNLVRGIAVEAGQLAEISVRQIVLIKPWQSCG